MKAYVLKCPDCGAHLKGFEAQPQGDLGQEGQTQCGYCGTDVIIERGSARLAGEPHVTTGGAPEGKDQGGGGVPVGVWLALVVFLFAGISAFMAAAGRNGQPNEESGAFGRGPDSAAQRTTTNASKLLNWRARLPLLTDVDGDGTHDLIGVALDPSKAVRLVAVSGNDGSRLWHSAAIPDVPESSVPDAYLWDDTLFVAGPAGAFSAFSARDGGTLWSIRMSDVVDDVACLASAANDPTTVLVTTADDVHHSVEIERGTVRGTVDKDELPQLIVLAKSFDPDVRPLTRADRVVFTKYVPGANAFEGIRGDFVLRSTSGAFSLYLGARAKGSKTPVLLCFDTNPDTGSFSSKWQSTVPGTEPLKARLPVGLQPYLHADPSIASVIYRTEGNGPHEFRVAAFDMSDGRRLWDEKIPGSSPFHSVTVNEGRVYLQSWKELRILDGATGKLQFSVQSVAF